MSDWILDNVSQAIAEDVGNGDLTALLIPAQRRASAQVITRENMILCGLPWFEAAFRHFDPQMKFQWHYKEAQEVPANTLLCELEGLARALVTAERTALNFLQSLSGTATLTRSYVEKIKDLPTQLLDTRKTIPGLRHAQKYATRIGGALNHRMGLYDAILIKENHISACGSIAQALTQIRRLYAHLPEGIEIEGIKIEIEVENLSELRQALEHGAERILLDNFTVEELRQAVAIGQGAALLEASGGITLDNIREIALTGVNYMSIGAITKHLHAVDLSLRIQYSDLAV